MRTQWRGPGPYMSPKQLLMEWAHVCVSPGGVSQFVSRFNFSSSKGLTSTHTHTLIHNIQLCTSAYRHLCFAKRLKIALSSCFELFSFDFILFVLSLLVFIFVYSSLGFIFLGNYVCTLIPLSIKFALFAINFSANIFFNHLELKIL